MELVKHNSEDDEVIPYFLNYYYKMKKSGTSNWFEWTNTTTNDRLMKYLNHISLVKLIHSRNILMQTIEAKGENLLTRISISKKIEERYVGTFANYADCSFLLIKHSRKPYVELFLSEKLKDDSYALLLKLEANELESEIKYYRDKYCNNTE